MDMRGATWGTVKPILKVLQEHFSGYVHVAYIIKPDNFWQKQRTSLASHKYKFEVNVFYKHLSLYGIFHKRGYAGFFFFLAIKGLTVNKQIVRKRWRLSHHGAVIDEQKFLNNNSSSRFLIFPVGK